VQLGVAAVIVLLAGVVAGGFGAMAALVVLAVVAWVRQDVPRSVAITISVMLGVMALAILFGFDSGMSASGHSSGVSHHTGNQRVPPAP
jgi:hypothetical protein